MSTAREVVAAQIKADNPSFIVSTYTESFPDNLVYGKTYVEVFRDRLEIKGNTMDHSLRVTVLVANQATETGEWDLDEALDLVLLSLERADRVTYSTVERGTTVDNYHACVVTANYTSQNVYKNLVREEQKAV